MRLAVLLCGHIILRMRWHLGNYEAVPVGVPEVIYSDLRGIVVTVAIFDMIKHNSRLAFVLN